MSNTGYNIYMKKLKKEIPKELRNKEQFIQSVSQDIENYIVSNPEISYEELCREFGSPYELVNSFIDNLDETQVKELFVKQKKMKKTIGVLSVVLGIFLILFFIVIPSIAVKVEIHTFIYETEYIYTTEPIE